MHNRYREGFKLWWTVSKTAVCILVTAFVGLGAFATMAYTAKVFDLPPPGGLTPEHYQALGQYSVLGCVVVVGAFLAYFWISFPGLVDLADPEAGKRRRAKAAQKNKKDL